MADFRAKSEYTTIPATIASVTVIEAGDLVQLTAGVVVKATAGATAIALAPQGSADGETVIEISKGRIELIGAAAANFAVTKKGFLTDLVVPGGVQKIDINKAEPATFVFRIASDNEAGTVGSADDVKVFINKPITF